MVVDLPLVLAGCVALLVGLFGGANKLLYSNNK
jgi:hypothetical protein